MSEKVVGNQYIYNGPGYLDSKIQPVDSVEDLNKILLRQRFIGLTVTVIHPDGPDSQPADYWLIQDPNEEEGVLMWSRKTLGGGSDVTVDTQTPDYIKVTRDGDTFYVDAAGNFIDDIEGLKEDVAGLESAVTVTNERITTEVDRIDGEISAVTETITHEVETINDRIDTEVSAITQTITNEVETINDRIDTEVSAITETITTEVERLDGEISGLTETVTREVDRIDQKNDEQDEKLDEFSQWHIEKLSEESGSTQYALVDGSGNTIGDIIEIIDEQYLETVVYISAATEEDKAIDDTVIIGDPYLKFIWKYGIITYVAIKDWVNDYFAGLGIAISPGHEISVKLADVEEGNDNYLSADEHGLRMNMFIEIDETFD